jgi:hypothetical protein
MCTVMQNGQKSDQIPQAIFLIGKRVILGLEISKSATLNPILKSAYTLRYYFTLQKTLQDHDPIIKPQPC